MSFFKKQLPQSNRVIACTIALMKAYFKVHCTANDQEPTKEDPHPVDMYQHTGSGKIINYEVKREGRSRQTGNVFLELNGLSAAHACGAERLFMWIDYSQNYIDVDLGDLITWLQTQDRYYKGNAGDAKKFGYNKANPGWAIPVRVLLEETPKLDKTVGDPDGKFCKGFGKYFWHEEDETWAAVSKMMR